MYNYFFGEKKIKQRAAGARRRRASKETRGSSGNKATVALLLASSFFKKKIPWFYSIDDDASGRPANGFTRQTESCAAAILPDAKPHRH
jgi:hypothetical protein